MDDNISKSLGLVPISTTQVTEERPAALSTDDSSDLDVTRSNLHDVIELGMNALQEMADIASQAQHPKAYDSLSSLINAVTNANKELRAQVLDKAKLTQSQGPQTINNNLVLTTKELQELISGRNDRNVSGEQES